MSGLSEWIVLHARRRRFVLLTRWLNEARAVGDVAKAAEIHAELRRMIDENDARRATQKR